MNTRYPGKPDYTGPTEGLFTLLHHEGPLLEWSDDVMKRVKYINEQKPEYERAIRLRHIVFFPENLWGEKLQKADAEWQKADAEWRKAYAERHKAYAEWQKVYAEWRKAYAERHKAYDEWQKAYAEWQKADAEWQKAYAEWRKADAEWRKAYDEWQKADADKILPYLKQHVEDCKWNGSTLVFN